MVKVTLSFITKKGSLNAPKHGRDPKEHVKKLTHLFLNDQFIDGIGDLSECRNLKVLYLHNNVLTVIDNLNFASHLTHLYLQRNKLKKIEGLDELQSLKKLYLGYNLISVIEGLERIKLLQELHVDHQQLPPGEELTFDPRSVATIGQSLKLLNLESDGLTSLEDLVGLEVIKVLNIANNNISDVTKIQAFLSSVPTLTELDIHGNPVISDYRNCNKILACAHNLCILNGKFISQSTLVFMKKLASRQSEIAVSEVAKHPYNLRETFSELAHNLPEALAKDVTSSILQNSAISKTVTENAIPELKKPPDDMMLTNVSYYHFPAFKSSTCLLFEGHTIPRQFHRLVKRDPSTGRHLSTRHAFSRSPIHDEAVNHYELVSKQMVGDTLNSNLTRDILNKGNMVWNSREAPKKH